MITLFAYMFRRIKERNVVIKLWFEKLVPQWLQNWNFSIQAMIAAVDIMMYVERPLINSSLSFNDCIKVPLKNQYLLRSNPAVECFSTTQFNTVLILSSFVAAFLSIGIPILVMVALYLRKVPKMRPYLIWTRPWLHILFRSYKKKYHWVFFFDQAEKPILLLMMFFISHTGIQSICMMLFIFISATFRHIMQPYISTLDNYGKSMCELSLTGIVCLRMLRLIAIKSSARSGFLWSKSDVAGNKWWTLDMILLVIPLTLAPIKIWVMFKSAARNPTLQRASKNVFKALSATTMNLTLSRADSAKQSSRLEGKLDTLPRSASMAISSKHSSLEALDNRSSQLLVAEDGKSGTSHSHFLLPLSAHRKKQLGSSLSDSVPSSSMPNPPGR
ncbi:uncharacterized protein BJ171DRAFT_494323 [Polychytrium aggregatum]|uniref:uncharacterized protein n=1 Tax=Polychytrium aggregatum TaxID=110093 RepID=UPI0022FEF75D|nr:uncharacterized protein BJ171DRAFT_494323 [Polychytrium aggregatum]KAI9207334.1 hypothetical protein BJ171DRAFT_494323 [Polychytrium aggregatum]